MTELTHLRLKWPAKCALTILVVLAWTFVRATPAFSEIISAVSVPPPSPESTRHYHSGNVLWVAATLWGFALPAVIFFSGFSGLLRDAAKRLQKRWYFTLIIYFVFFAIICFLANLPLDYYSDFVRPHDYGLSEQTFGKWASDALMGLGVGLIGGALFLWIPFLLLKRATKRWWLYTWFASIPIMVFIAFVQPIWIDPLFNRFGPMHDKVLETRILGLAHRAGISGANVYEVNKSVDTKTLNAYVTGIGETTRIVLWDTILKELTPDEVAVTMGHEMGHYTLGHRWKFLVFESLTLFVGLWFIHFSAGWVLRRFGTRARVTELGDFASLPLLILIFSLVLFVLWPPLLAVSRHFEHEADRFALEITHDNHACATTFIKFMRHDLAYPTPSPFFEFLRASHPSVSERIGFCNTYHPWLDGGVGRYSHYIGGP
jgi:Zn-dependent protease with chaperone function